MQLTPAEVDAIFISLKVSLTATLFTLPLALLTAYLLARKEFRFKPLLESIIMSPIVIPPLVTGYLLLILFGRNGPIGSWLSGTLGIDIAFTWIGATIAAGIVAFPLMVRTLQVSLASIPEELEGVSRTLGATSLDCFFSVTLPLAWPAILSATVLGFARSLGEFGATIILAGNLPGKTQTIPLAIFNALNRPGGETKVWLLVSISLVISIAALVFSHYLDKSFRKNAAGRKN